MKWAVITGAAGGMGLAAARRLIEAGWNVFGLDQQEPAPTPALRFLRADLTDEASVAACLEPIRAATDRIDAIVHLAGRYDLDSLAEMDPEALKRIFEINLFAAARVNRLLLPLLGQGSRIVITTSELAPLDPLPFMGVYAISKAALDRYAFSLRMEVQLLGIDVIVLRPGAVQTGMLDVSTARLDRFCENTALYRVNAARFRQIVGRVEARKIPPERVAGLILRALTARRPRYVYTINRNPLLLLLNALPGRWQTAIIGHILRTLPEQRAAPGAK